MVSATTAAAEKLYQPQTRTSSNDDVSRDDFLKLLIAQLQHQDPLNPVENQEFVAELATFSSLEQQEQQTSLLRDLVEDKTDRSNAEAIALVGKEAIVSTNEFFYSPGEEVEFAFDAPSKGVIPVLVTDALGRQVYSGTVSVSEPGQVHYTFSAENVIGKEIPAGDYRITIGGSLDPKTGEQTQLPVYLKGHVDGVNFVDGVPIVIVDGQAVPYGAVYGVYEPEED